jgi:tRNA A37 threonylcarbamoyladenosine modification protein TsaB
MMAGLAITGSQRSVGVAAWREGGAIVAVDHLEPSRDRDWLWPSIEEACNSAGLAPAALAWVAVDVGPGGFSGLRTTIAAAQSIATVHGLPCLAVPSALVAACSTWPTAAPDAPEFAHAVLAVKGATAWIATLVRDRRGWFQSEASVIEWVSWVPCAGSIVLADAHCPATVVQACQAHSVPIVEPNWTGAGAMMAARRLWEAGQRLAPSALSPEYAREPEAVTLWRQRHGG